MGAGKVYAVGLGPGAGDDLTGRARAALDRCDLFCGYGVYLDLVRAEYPDKESFETPMRQERARCEAALAAASRGRTVGMLCSGDAGIYGMAGLLIELAEYYPGVEIETVPGVTAANGGAAVLGAPLMHDFAVVSLSDLMTPWERIAARLRAAAEADFVIVLYNPASKKRADYLRRACEILLRYKAPETVCGYVRRIGRAGEESGILTLAELVGFSADMFTTIYIGNSETREIGGKMVTPRGYSTGRSET